MKKAISKSIKTTTRYSFTYEDLREALDLPEDSIIYVNAPTGGDCSGTALGIGEEVDFLEVRTVEITTEES